jgi:peroxiredoxin
MAQLRRDYQKFIDRNTEVIAVGPENANTFTKWWHEHEMPFIGIPDPEHAIAEGLYRQQSKIFKGGRMPALGVIDRDMKVRFMHYADSMSDIPSNEEILSLLEALNKEDSFKGE